MALQIASEMAPAGTGTYYLLEDIYVKGGLQIRDTKEARDAIAIANLKVGALVMTLDDKKIWQVDVLTFPSRENPDAEEKVEWKELVLGGGGSGGDGTPLEPGEVRANTRQVAIHTIDNLQIDESKEFELKMGASSMVLKLETSRPVRLRAYGSPEKEEINPYEFISTEDHLVDDGRQLMADGSVFRTRNYSIFANFQSPLGNFIFFTVDNIEETEGPLVVTVTFVTMEVAPGDESDVDGSDGGLEGGLPTP